MQRNPVRLLEIDDDLDFDLPPIQIGQLDTCAAPTAEELENLAEWRANNPPAATGIGSLSLGP